MYTQSSSLNDGATVPIVYEGRTARGRVADEDSLDRLFDDMFQELDRGQLEELKARYATSGHVLEAPG